MAGGSSALGPTSPEQCPSCGGLAALAGSKPATPAPPPPIPAPNPCPLAPALPIQHLHRGGHVCHPRAAAHGDGTRLPQGGEQGRRRNRGGGESRPGLGGSKLRRVASLGRMQVVPLLPRLPPTPTPPTHTHPHTHASTRRSSESTPSSPPRPNTWCIAEWGGQAPEESQRCAALLAGAAGLPPACPRPEKRPLHLDLTRMNRMLTRLARSLRPRQQPPYAHL